MALFGNSLKPVGVKPIKDEEEEKKIKSQNAADTILRNFNRAVSEATSNVSPVQKNNYKYAVVPDTGSNFNVTDAGRVFRDYANDTRNIMDQKHIGGAIGQKVGQSSYAGPAGTKILNKTIQGVPQKQGIVTKGNVSEKQPVSQQVRDMEAAQKSYDDYLVEMGWLKSKPVIDDTMKATPADFGNLAAWEQKGAQKGYLTGPEYQTATPEQIRTQIAENDERAENARSWTWDPVKAAGKFVNTAGMSPEEAESATKDAADVLKFYQEDLNKTQSEETIRADADFFTEFVYDKVHKQNGAFQRDTANMTPEQKKAFVSDLTEELVGMVNPYYSIGEAVNAAEGEYTNPVSENVRLHEELNKAEKKVSLETLADGLNVDSRYVQTNDVLAPGIDVYGFSVVGKSDADEIAYYINQESAGLNNRNGAATKAWTSGENKYYFLTPKERERFNKLYNAGFTTAAKEYAESLDDDLQKRQAEFQAKHDRENAQDPYLGWLQTIDTVLVNPAAGLGTTFGSIMALFGNKDYADPSHPIYALQRYVNTTRQTRGEEWGKGLSGGQEEGFWYDTGNFLYGIGTSLADMMYAQFISGGYGTNYITEEVKKESARKWSGRIMQAIMSTEATGNTFVSLLENGYDPTEAVLTSWLSGGIEAFTEKYSIEALLHPEQSKTLWRYLLKTSLAEGSEEMASDLLNTGVNCIMSAIYGHENDIVKDARAREDIIREEIRTGVRGKMSEDEIKKEAGRQAMGAWLGSVGLSGLAGAVSGVAMGGGSYAVGKVSGSIDRSRANNEQAAYLNQNADVDTLLQNAAQVAEQSGNTNLQKTVEKAVEKKARTGSLTDRQLSAVTKAMAVEGTETQTQVRKDTVIDSVKEEIDKRSPEGTVYSDQVKQEVAEEVAGALMNGTRIAADRMQQITKMIPQAEQIINELMDQGSRFAQDVTDKVSNAVSQKMDRFNDWMFGAVEKKSSEQVRTEVAEKKATVTVDGAEKAGRLGKITEVGPDARVQMVTADGETVTAPVKDVKADSDTVGTVYKAATQMDTAEGANAFVNAYNVSEGMNLNNFNAAFHAVVDAAMSGTGIEKGRANLVAQMPQMARQIAQSYGEQKIAKVESMLATPDDVSSVVKKKLAMLPTDGAKAGNGVVMNVNEGTKISNYQATQILYVDYMARQFGHKYTVVSGEDLQAQGQNRGNESIISLNNTEDLLTQVAGHEWYHGLRRSAENDTTGTMKGVMDDYNAFALEVLKNDKNYNLDERIATIQKRYEAVGQNLTREQAMEELLAEESGAVFTKMASKEYDQFLKTLKEENPSLLQRIRDFFGRFLETMKRGLQSIAARGNEEVRAIYEADIDTVQILYDKLTDAMLTNNVMRESTSPDMDNAIREGVEEGTVTEQKDSMSLKSEIETEDNGLLAVHAINSDRIPGLLKFGGIPAPSIAVSVTRSHARGKFGDVSLVFDKNTIDPSIMSENRVYTRDAWTAMFPETRKTLFGDRIALTGKKLNAKNIVEAMGMQNEKSGTFGTLGGRTYLDATMSNPGELMYNISSEAAGKYQNIAEVQADRNRLGTATDEQIRSKSAEVEKVFMEAADKVISFYEGQNAYDGLSAEDADHSKAGTILNIFRQVADGDEWVKGYLPADVYRAVQNGLKAIYSIPAEYSEAKPMRVVDYSEVRTAIVPEGQTEAISALRKAGIPVVTYDGSQQDRLAKLNSPEVQSVRFSVKADDKVSVLVKEAQTKQDNDYMEAVNNGDTETAQQFVNEAAERMFPDSKIRDEDGNLLIVYHGSDQDFNVFDMNKSRTNMDIQGSFFSPWDIDAEGYGPNVRAFYLDIKNPAPENIAYRALHSHIGQNGAGRMAREDLIRMGYDGVNNGTEEFIAFYPEQIKSADPVTYDDNGNIIPPSERFNESKPDIRYSVKDSEYIDAVNGGDMETAQKMVDEAAAEAGYTNRMYHGTKGGKRFNVFRDWQYFTENRDYAMRYAKHDENSLYTAYVKAEHPFDTRNPKERSIFNKIRSEYGLTDLSQMDNGLPDWTDGYDLSEYISENDLDYDMILLDEGGDPSENGPVSRGISYVVRNSAQIKDASAVTYDDNGNVIPLSERFNESNPDIRYSQKDNAVNAEMAQIMSENADLKRDLQKVLEELNGTGTRVESADVHKMARRIKSEYFVKMPLSQFEAQLERAMNAIAQSRSDAELQTGMSMLTNVAYEALSTSEQADRERYNQYKDFRDQMRLARWVLTDSQWQKGANLYGSREEFRKAMFGKWNISTKGEGTSLEGSTWNELCDLYPELFDRDTNEADKVSSIINALDNTAITVQNPYGMNIEQYAADLALRMYDDMASDIRIQRGTSADLAQERELNRRLEDELNNLRQSTQMARQMQIERTQVAGAKAQIIRQSSSLLKKLEGTSKAGVIPEQMRESVTSLLNALDMFHTNQGKLTAQMVMEAKQAYESLNRINGNETDYTDTANAFYNGDLAEDFDKLAENADGKALRYLKYEDLERVRRIVAGFSAAVNQENRLLADAKRAEISEIGDGMLETAYARKEHKSQSAIGKKISESLGQGLLKPVTVAHMFEGTTLEPVFDRVRKASDKHFRNVDMAENYLEDALEEYGIQKQIDQMSTKKGYQESRVPVELITGRKIYINKQEAMTVYAVNKREHLIGTNHLLGGGIKLRNVARGESMDTIRLTAQDVKAITDILSEEDKKYVDHMVEFITRIGGQWGNEVSRKLYGVDKYTEGYYIPFEVDRGSIAEEPGVEQDKRIVSASFTKQITKKASSALNITPFTELWCSHVERMSDFNAFALPLQDLTRVMNYRSEGETMRNAISRGYGQNITQYISDYIKRLNGNSVRERGGSWINWFMSKAKGASVTFNASVAIQQMGAGVRAMSEIDPKYYIPGMAKGLNVNKSYAEMRKYAAVGINKDWGYFDTASNRNLYMRHQNNFNSWLNEAGGKLAELGDRLNWAQTWEAVKNEQRAINKKAGEPVSGEAFLQQCGDRFTEVVDKTQVVDSIQQRAAWATEKGLMARSMAFMSEPVTMYNMLYRDYWDLKDAIENHPEKKKAAIAHAVRSICAIVITNALTAALKSVVSAARDRDNEKKEKDEEGKTVITGVRTFGDKYMDALLPNFMDNIAGIGTIFTNMINDSTSSMGSSDLSIAALQNFVRFFKEARKIGQIDEDGNMTSIDPYKIAYYGAQTISNLTGIGFGGAVRDSYAAVKTILDYANSDELTGTAWDSHNPMNKRVKAAEKNYVVAKMPGQGDRKVNTKIWKSLLYEAYVQDGNSFGTNFNMVSDAMIRNGGTADKVASSFKTMFADNDERVTKAAQALVSGDIDTASAIMTGMANEGLGMKVVSSMVNTKYNSLTASGEETEEGPGTTADALETLQESKVTTSPIKTAIKTGVENGTISDADAVRQLMSNQLYVDQNDAYWDVQEWKAKANGAEKFSKYDASRNAIDSGDRKALTAAVKELINHGTKKESVKTEICGSILKKQYMAAGKNSRAESNAYNMADDALRTAGFSAEERKKYLQGWTKEKYKETKKK